MGKEDRVPSNVEKENISLTRNHPTTTQALKLPQKDFDQEVKELAATQIVVEKALHKAPEAESPEDRQKRVEAELRFLLDLTQSVSVASDFEDALTVVLKALCVQEERLYGEVWLPDEENSFLTLARFFHLEPNANLDILQFRQQSQKMSFAPGEGLMGEAWQSAALIWVEDITKMPEYPLSKPAAVSGLHAVLAIPILANSDIVAVLALYKNIPNKRDERFLALATAAAIQLGFVLRSKQAEAALRKSQAELEARVNKRTEELVRVNRALEQQILEREETEEMLKRRNHELDLLYRFSQIINSSLDIEHVLTPFAQLFSEELNMLGGFVFCYDVSRRQLFPKLSWGLDEEMAAVMMRWPLTDNPLFQNVGASDTVWYSQLEQCDFFVEIGLVAARPNWESFMAMPVLIGDNMQGAFGLFGQKNPHFGQDKWQFFRALRQVLATAVQNANLFDAVSQSREQLRRIAHRIFTSQEEERHRVSHELHDEAGQALTGLKFHLEMVLKALTKQVDGLADSKLVELREQMKIAVQLCQSMMDTIRSLAHMLHPPVLENLGLNTALSSFCREFGRHAHLSIRYEGQEIPTLPEAVEIGLYRILQEALNNVARHAGTNSVQVQLQHDANVISLTVKDDGLGFDVGRMINTTLHTEGIGLSGMQERIESVGGRLIIESAPGQGSTIIVWIPL